MRMLANFLLVDPEPRSESKIGSIVLPDNTEARKTFGRGKVIEKGPGVYLHNGDRPDIDVAVGEYVLYFKASAVGIVVKGKEMHIVEERVLLAVLEAGDLNDTIKGETEDGTA